MKKLVIYTVTVIGILELLLSCSNDLEVTTDYGFSVKTLPVPKKIKKDETVEIRCQLVREDRYKETKYFLRYFQPDGKGILKDEQGRVFEPNDSYPLSSEIFRLYYTSQSTDQQKIDITFYDSFGREVELSFNFTNDAE